MNKFLFRFLLSAFVIIGLLLGYQQCSAPVKKDLESSDIVKEVAAPDFTVYDGEGNAVKFSDFNGKPVVLHFWTSWCDPCKKELPIFEQASKDYKDVVFMIINVTDGKQESKEGAMIYINNNAFTFNSYYDTSAEAKAAYGIVTVPSTVFINSNGIASIAIAEVMKEQDLKEQIEKLS